MPSRKNPPVSASKTILSTAVEARMTLSKFFIFTSSCIRNLKLDGSSSSDSQSTKKSAPPRKEVPNLEADLSLMKDKSKIADAVETSLKIKSMEDQIKKLKAENNKLKQALNHEHSSKQASINQISTLAQRASEDREWLEQQTANRRAEAKEIKDKSEACVKSARRRLSTTAAMWY